MQAETVELWKEWHALGHRHQLLGEWDKASHYYELALAHNPGYAPAQLALAQLAMMRSGFRKGRELYETRFSARESEGGFDWRQLPIPRWRGGPLTGKRLHLWVEQGFGDVIMYAAFLPHLLAQRPLHITLSIFPKMMSLFARSFPGVNVEPLTDIGRYAIPPVALGAFPRLLELAQKTGTQVNLESMRKDYEHALRHGAPDYTAPMGDLMVYGLPGFIPASHQQAFLQADSERVATTRQKLKDLGPDRLIGISWHTSNAESGHVRSIPLKQWLPVLTAPNCHFISLQHHVSKAEIERFCAENNCRIIVPEFDPVSDTEGLAALTACMDEVITIDNSNAHLAGGLSIPTTLLLPKGHDFRWPVLEDGQGTLWYASVRTERQEQPMDWQSVIARVAARLRG